MNQPLRQGDVLFIRVSEIPAEAKVLKPEKGRYILAHGEATGHHHCAVVEHDEAEMVSVGTGDAAERYLRVRQQVAITHEEHQVGTIPPGDYLVLRQVEESAQAIQRVWD